MCGLVDVNAGTLGGQRILDSSEAGLRAVVSHPMWVLELILGPLKEQLVP